MYCKRKVDCIRSEYNYDFINNQWKTDEFGKVISF